jgi:threonine dehydrogenase-like Zn-dependent dehydrogenase
MMTSNYPQPFYPVTIEDIHERIFELVGQGRVNVKDLITDIVSPAAANATYARIGQDKAGTCGVVYDWSLL